MSNRYSSITLQDSTYIKGWAILLIVLHNFFHLIYDVTKENEMDFDAGRFESLVTVTLFNPTEWAHGFFTFFGHFGVQLFIFLSAYGMTKAHANASSAKLQFLSSRLKRIYPTFLLAIALWLVAITARDILLLHISLPDELVLLRERLFDALKVVLGIHNLVPGHVYPKVGPWWFIPFIVQFYVLWALISEKLMSLPRAALFALGVGGVVFNYIATPLIAEWAEVNLLFSPLGHMAEIILGVYWARFGFSIPGGLALGALAVFVLSSMFESFYPLHHLSALVLLLWSIFCLLSYRSHYIDRPLQILGIYSMPLFFVNGFLRQPFLKMSEYFDTWYADILAAIAFVLFALMVAVFLHRAEKYLVKSSTAA